MAGECGGDGGGGVCVLQPVSLQGLSLPEVFSLEGTRERERGNRDPLDFKGSSPRDFRKIKERL